MIHTSKKITGAIAKVAEIICMITIATLVFVIVLEVIRRKFFNQSFTGNVQLCGILFLWMAFIGLIPLYNNSGLMRLDFLVSKAKGAAFEVIYFVNKLFSLALGIVMVIAFSVQLEFVGTRTYPSFSIKIPYTIQYIPMAIAGVFIAIKSLEQLVERVLIVTGKLSPDTDA